MSYVPCTAAGYLKFDFYCSSATTVSWYGMQVAPNGKADSFFIAVDADEATAATVTPSTIAEVWHTRVGGKGRDGSLASLTFVESSASPAFSVTAGPHSLFILEREDGIAFSSFTFSSGASTCAFAAQQPCAQVLPETNSTLITKPSSCADVKTFGAFTLSPPGMPPFTTLCDEDGFQKVMQLHGTSYSPSTEAVSAASLLQRQCEQFLSSLGLDNRESAPAPRPAVIFKSPAVVVAAAEPPRACC